MKLVKIEEYLIGLYYRKILEEKILENIKKSEIEVPQNEKAIIQDHDQKQTSKLSKVAKKIFN